MSDIQKAKSEQGIGREVGSSSDEIEAELRTSSIQSSTDLVKLFSMEICNKLIREHIAGKLSNMQAGAMHHEGKSAKDIEKLEGYLKTSGFPDFNPVGFVAERILSQVKPIYLQGKNPRSIAGAAIYAAAKVLDLNMSLSRISELTLISENGLRQRYNELSKRLNLVENKEQYLQSLEMVKSFRTAQILRERKSQTKLQG